MDLTFDDLDFEPLGHEEAFAVFDEFYGSPTIAPADQAVQDASADALEVEAAAPNAEDEFADLMVDIDQFADAPLPGLDTLVEDAPLPQVDSQPEDAAPLDDAPAPDDTPSRDEAPPPDDSSQPEGSPTPEVAPQPLQQDAPLPDLDLLQEDAPLPDGAPPSTAQLEDPFTGMHSPATPGFLAPGPSATSIFHNGQPSYSPQLPQDNVVGVAQNMPSHSSPEAPSTGNRSLMQAEMRQEEDVQSSPLPVTPVPFARSSLGSAVRNSDAQVSDTDHVATNHMHRTPDPQADIDDDLPTPKSWNFDGLSPQKTDNTQQPATEEGTAAEAPTPTDSTSQPLPDTDQSHKRNREISSSPEIPLAKRQRSRVPDTNATKAEIVNNDKGTRQQSRVNQLKKPVRTKAAEESDSSLTDTSTELKSSPLVANTLSNSNAMATPNASAKAKKTDKKKKVEREEVVMLDGDEITLETPMDDEEFDDDVSPKWGFGALKEDTPQKAKSPSPKKKSKGKGKAKATGTVLAGTKRGNSASTEPTNTPPVKRTRVGGRELDSLIGKMVMDGVRKQDASPRKTRKERKDEEDAKPNAAGAAKKRQSGGKGK